MKILDDCVLFKKDWLSNYTLASFCYPNKDNPILFFGTSEQAFMYFKALYFKDYEKADKIYRAQNKPSLCFVLGRQIKNYNDEAWKKVRYQLFYDLNYQKFLQNDKLREKVLSEEFDNKIFAEAFEDDDIWGIGIDENIRTAKYQRYWKGQNLLGKILTNIRNRFKAGNPENWDIYL